MRLLFVTPPLDSENAGGIQTSGRIAWEILRTWPDTELLEIDVRRPVTAMRAARRTRSKPDVILFWHLDLLRLSLLLPAAGRVVFLHGIEAWRRPAWSTRRLLRDTALIANSRYTLTRAHDWHSARALERAQVVPLGWGQPAQQNSTPAEVPIAIMIGRLDGAERYKGHHEVITAWPQVQARIPDAQLFIVGEGDLRAELESHAAAMNVSGATRFFGRLEEPEKERLLAHARCLVLPSRGEGFGLVYLEAMRLGRPCLTGRDGGAEVVGAAAGMQVDPTDRAQLAEALVSLLTIDDHWYAQSRAARARYEAQFTAHHFGQRLEQALRQIN